VDLVHGARDVEQFSLSAARVLRRSVAFDGMCMLTLDPATSLPTSEVSENGLPLLARPRMAQIEIGHDDVNSFAGLIRSGRHAASLSQATGGDLERSLRHRELRAPNGLGDELRIALLDEGTAWGGLTLMRGEDAPPFTAEDVALLRSLSKLLAEGVRRAILQSALSAHRQEDETGPGLLLLAADDSILATDVSGGAWLTQFATTAHAQLPQVVTAVANRAHSAEPLLARARVRSASGTWLIVRGSALEGDGDARTAITIEPARAHDLAPLIAEAYGLTERERTVTQLVARGLTTDAIAGRLHISPWTVQDHLKSIFGKVGVSTRGELTARVFFEHYAPRLCEQAPIGRDGWFAEDGPASGD
jgi:DNA-binding CsgD family transcriptional regulator